MKFGERKFNFEAKIEALIDVRWHFMKIAVLLHST